MFSLTDNKSYVIITGAVGAVREKIESNIFKHVLFSKAPFKYCCIIRMSIAKYTDNKC